MSQQNLIATLHMGNGAAHAAGQPNAPRVSSSPDPRMDGRAVYMMAIQMQNITSYSGSWMVWFAEHQPLPGTAPLEMRPPDPLHKVDPKYIADAVLERVEGTVRLSAVIRKDGHVEAVELLKHLDDRLDKSAEEALAKWQFQPALRDGTPVDVDAVFEIPFRLAPKTTK
jgi:TonB family protein